VLAILVQHQDTVRGHPNRYGVRRKNSDSNRLALLVRAAARKCGRRTISALDRIEQDRGLASILSTSAGRAPAARGGYYPNLATNSVSVRMTTYRILVLNHIASTGLHRFPPARYVVDRAVEHPDAILVRSHDMHGMAIPQSVRAIGRAGVGTNNIPVTQLSTRGIPVFNAPGANANAVKELVLAALLLAARNVIPALGYVGSLERDAPDLEHRIEAGKKQFAGVELPGRTLGIVGLGAIGGLVADAAIKLGMNVTGFDPEITVEAAWRLPSTVRKAHSIEELLKQSDFVTLHVPLSDVTRQLINEHGWRR